MEQVIAKTRSRRTQQQIIDLLAAFDKGGYTVKEFCELKGISQGNFHRWKSRRKETRLKTKKVSGFTEVLVGAGSSDQLFAEVNGIRFFQAVSAAYLKEIIA